MPVKQKIKKSLRENNTCKKTPIDDCGLGYSDFTLSLAFRLPHTQQNNIAIVPTA